MSNATHRAPRLARPRTAATVGLVGLSAGAVALIPSPGHAETLAQAKAQYQRDLSASEDAGQVYDQQQQAYAQLQQRIDSLQAEISEQNQQIAALGTAIGLQAAQQYRDSGVSDTLELALSSSPDTYLDKAASQNEMASQEAARLKTVAKDQASLRAEQALAATLVHQQQQALGAARTALSQANGLTAAAKELIASLTPAQQRQVDPALSDTAANSGYSGALPPVSGRASLAVQYAESKVGDAYVTGGTGPDEFDCSGLTQQAWKAAGISIERTSYEQWDTLPHISGSELEPGDLIFFNWDSAMGGPGHVAIYVGNGMYIQATHPDSDVQWASLDPGSPSYGDMPIVGYARVD